MKWRCPWWVSVAMHLGGFRWQRRVVQAWVCWDCSDLASTVRNLAYRMRHPIIMAGVDRRVRLLRRGIGILDA